MVSNKQIEILEQPTKVFASQLWRVTEAVNVVSLLISADFLSVVALVAELVEWVHHHANTLLMHPTRLCNIPDHLVNRQASSIFFYNWTTRYHAYIEFKDSTGLNYIMFEHNSV